jgi:hypothetical protein
MVKVFFIGFFSAGLKIIAKSNENRGRSRNHRSSKADTDSDADPDGAPNRYELLVITEETPGGPFVRRGNFMVELA